MLFYAILNECRFCIMQYVAVVAKKQKIKKTIKFICEILKKHIYLPFNLYHAKVFCMRLIRYCFRI